MKKIVLFTILISSFVFAGKIWFDFSTPLSAYIQAAVKNKDWFGASAGMQIWKIPQFEVTYVRIGEDHYALLKPIMLEGEITSVQSDQIKMNALLNIGIDGSYPGYSSGDYLTTGIDLYYETAGRQGVFFKLCIEAGVRLELNKGTKIFSPYYIQIFGPLVMKPSLIIGGKF